jgi:hypothetical protein
MKVSIEKESKIKQITIKKIKTKSDILKNIRIMKLKKKTNFINYCK